MSLLQVNLSFVSRTNCTNFTDNQMMERPAQLKLTIHKPSSIRCAIPNRRPLNALWWFVCSMHIWPPSASALDDLPVTWGCWLLTKQPARTKNLAFWLAVQRGKGKLLGCDSHPHNDPTELRLWYLLFKWRLERLLGTWLKISQKVVCFGSLLRVYHRNDAK